MSFRQPTWPIGFHACNTGVVKKFMVVKSSKQVKYQASKLSLKEKQVKITQVKGKSKLALDVQTMKRQCNSAVKSQIIYREAGEEFLQLSAALMKTWPAALAANWFLRLSQNATCSTSFNPKPQRATT